MQRPLQRIAMLIAICICPLAVQAQIKPAAPPTATRPVSVPAPVRPTTAPAVVPISDQAMRDQLASHPISSEGSSTAPAIAQPVAPLRVYDSKGQLRNGMQPAGQNRVLDTRTGRYHDTVPSGDGQRIVH